MLVPVLRTSTTVPLVLVVLYERLQVIGSHSLGTPYSPSTAGTEKCFFPGMLAAVSHDPGSFSIPPFASDFTTLFQLEKVA